MDTIISLACPRCLLITNRGWRFTRSLVQVSTRFDVTSVHRAKNTLIIDYTTGRVERETSYFYSVAHSCGFTSYRTSPEVFAILLDMSNNTILGYGEYWEVHEDLLKKLVNKCHCKISENPVIIKYEKNLTVLL